MISNCRKGIMGTVEFDGKFPSMRKTQDFIVYPMQESGSVITIQSEHRFGQIDLETGRGIISANRGQYANSLWLALCKMQKTAVEFTLVAEDAQTLRQWVKSTGGLAVGRSIVISDNTGAMAL